MCAAQGRQSILFSMVHGPTEIENVMKYGDTTDPIIGPTKVGHVQARLKFLYDVSYAGLRVVVTIRLISYSKLKM